MPLIVCDEGLHFLTKVFLADGGFPTLLGPHSRFGGKLLIKLVVWDKHLINLIGWDKPLTNLIDGDKLLINFIGGDKLLINFIGGDKLLIDLIGTKGGCSATGIDRRATQCRERRHSFLCDIFFVAYPP